MNSNINKNRLKIRAWEETDAESLAEQANSINIWNNVRDNFPHPYTLKDANDYIAYVQSQPVPQNFAIVIDDKAVGGIGIIPQNDVERFNAEIGYWIGENYWNKGYMTEALQIVINYLFEYTNITRLFATIFKYNITSARVMEKVGFQRVGTMNKAAFKNNTFVDMVYYELVK